jgi:DNA-binding response OmpR family regulator
LLAATDRSISIVTVTHVVEVTTKHLVALDLAVVVLGSDDLAADLRGIRDLTSRTRKPVIAVSARDGIRATALDHGAGSFIHYGNAPEDVLATIRRAFSGPDELTGSNTGTCS